MHYHTQTKTYIMKRLTLLLLVATSFAYTGCVKELFKKKDDKKQPLPEEKYYGTTWRATKIAQDANKNGRPDASETFAFQGSSILQLAPDKKFSYTLTTASMSGTWSLSTDEKSITINDPAQGSIRFDYKTDTEFITEPIPDNGGDIWIFYSKQ
jgi:hypothetical protein